MYTSMWLGRAKETLLPLEAHKHTGVHELLRTADFTSRHKHVVDQRCVCNAPVDQKLLYGAIKIRDVIELR